MIYSKLISSVIFAFLEISTINKILENKFLLNKKIIISCLIISIYQFFSYNITNNFIRPIIIVWILVFISHINFKKNIAQSIFSAFIAWLLILISEIIYMIFSTLIFNINLELIQTNSYIYLITNISICIINIILLQISPFINLIRKICIKLKHINITYLVVIIFSISIAFSASMYLTYIKVNIIHAFILNLIILLAYTLIIANLFNEKEKNYNMNKNIINISENLLEYEKMLDYQRVANHENKNQLLVIKGMIKKNEKGIDKYIDSIVKEKREDNEDFYMKTKRIPSGGLQGLVYYKLLIMKDKNINIGLNINSNVRKVKLEELGVDINKDICKITGIFLDNAMQAVENLNKKNIDINMLYENEKFKISISNNFEGDMDFSKIGEIGYTTKGNGHGYGLSLVKKIIEKNKMFNNKKTINRNTFTQNLEIDIKK